MPRKKRESLSSHKLTLRVDRETHDMAERLCDVLRMPLTAVFRQAILRLWQHEQPLIKTLREQQGKNGQQETPHE